MTLIKSISGIQATIGDSAGEGLSQHGCCQIHCSLCSVGQREESVKDQLI
jgi:hypothetical protein